MYAALIRASLTWRRLLVTVSFSLQGEFKTCFGQDEVCLE